MRVRNMLKVGVLVAAMASTAEVCDPAGCISLSAALNSTCLQDFATFRANGGTDAQWNSLVEMCAAAKQEYTRNCGW